MITGVTSARLPGASYSYSTSTALVLNSAAFRKYCSFLKPLNASVVPNHSKPG